MVDQDATGRRGRLRGTKLRALVRDHLGRDVDAEPSPFPPGAAVVDGAMAWVLLEDGPGRGLGAALAWSLRHGADAVNVLAAADTATLARRALAFDVPVTVRRVEDRALLAAAAAPLPEPPLPPVGHVALVGVIEAGGATPVVEHGVVTGEVRGLEVCRVVDDPFTGAVRLEVGVGAHDREAFAMLHGDTPTVDALAGVVAAVEQHRRPGASQHPLNRLAQERMLRWRLECDPALIGLVELAPAEPPLPRPNVRDAVPCVAHGRRSDGGQVVVVCSVGVDLDLIPFATDARVAARPGAFGDGLVDTIVVVPARDLVPVTVDLAGRLVAPVELRPLG